MHEFNTEYDDTLSDFKKSIIDFNKRVTEVSKNLSNITKEHEDLSNAAHIAAGAQDLLNVCSMKLETTDKELKKILKTLETKINNDDFYKLIQKKMDRQEVNIPLNNSLGFEYHRIRGGKETNSGMSQKGNITFRQNYQRHGTLLGPKDR